MSRRTPPRFSTADAVREALHALGARPGRSALAALSLVIGVAAVVAVLATQLSAAAAIDRQFDSLGVDDVTLTLTAATGGTDTAATANSTPRFELAAVERVRTLPWVDTVVARLDLGRREVAVEVFDGASTTRSTQDIVAASDGLDQAGASLLRGRWPTAFEYRHAAGVVVLSQASATALGVDDLADLPTVVIDGQRLSVVGVADPGPRLGGLSGAVWVGLPASATLFGQSGVDVIDIRAVPGAGAAVARDAPLAANPQDPARVGVESALGAQQTRAAVTSTLDSLTLALAVIVLVVGGVGIGSMTLVSVLSRTHEIAVRRAVGATRWHVFRQVLAESLLLGVAGALAGFALGLGVGVLIAEARGWPLAAPTAAMALVPVFAVVMGIGGGVGPAVRASRIPPALALRAL